MNPSFEPSWTLQMGSTKNPKPGNPFEGQFSSPEARMVVEPRMQFLGLCSFNARRKSRFLVLGAKKRRFFGAPKKKKNAEKYFWGVEKVIWPPNTITRRRRKKKKSRGFSAWAPKNIAPYNRRPPKKPIFYFLFWAPKKQESRRKTNRGPKKKCGGRNFFGGVEKVI